MQAIGGPVKLNFPKHLESFSLERIVSDFKFGLELLKVKGDVDSPFFKKAKDIKQLVERKDLAKLRNEVL